MTGFRLPLALSIWMGFRFLAGDEITLFHCFSFVSLVSLPVDPETNLDKNDRDTDCLFKEKFNDGGGRPKIWKWLGFLRMKRV